MSRRILFVLKYREHPYEIGSDTSHNWGTGSGKFLHSGLYNSARFVVDMLQSRGYAVKLVHVRDNNGIHKEIVDFKATDVIIEAFWVVPEKFTELAKVCPDVKFIIRSHSETPFLANEGIAFDWAMKYLRHHNVSISCNSLRALDEMRSLAIVTHPHIDGSKRIIYLPNYYPITNTRARSRNHKSNELNIGCFGAIRPFKNQVMQAVAAIEYATLVGKRLKFHINSNRVEQNGSPILRNLRAIFDNCIDHELVEQPWKPHHEFKKLISTMDVLMQVSFTETFNIVAADAVSTGVPLVTSPEIYWANSISHANPTDSASIVNALARVQLLDSIAPFWNQNLAGLKKYNKESISAWTNFLNRIE